MTSLTTQYSLWFVPICLIGGFLYAWFLYRKDRKLKDVSKLFKTLMFAFRFFSVSIISFLLLSPTLKNLGKIIEKPLILYAQDNSESVLNNKNKIKKIASELNTFFKSNTNYNFKTFTFGESVKETDSFNFDDEETNMAQVLTDLKNRFYNQNIGAIILASDGIYNKGNNPDFEVHSLNFPIYTIALGDTTVRKDLILSAVKYNKTAFLNSKFPLKIKIKADKLKGEKTELKIFDNKHLIHNQLIKINSDDYYKILNLKISANKIGFHKIKITLSQLSEEATEVNNSEQIIIEVSDRKQKILILSDAPHPDIAAFKDALKLNQNFVTDYYQTSAFTKSINTYNLIILNQLPSKFNSSSALLRQIINSDIPIIYMLGTQSSLEKFDNLNTGLTTGAYSNAPDEVTGKLNDNFSLFDINPEIENITLNAPPLLSAFGDYKLYESNQILFYRQITNINTKLPLIAFHSGTGTKKFAFITGEGIWRWRFFDYKINQNHYLFNELINNIVQYMISKENKSQFHIIADKVIPENHKINIQAKTFDKNFQPVDVKKITFEYSDSLQNKKTLQFEKTTDGYRLNIGKLQAGDYLWKANTVINGKKYKQNGIFSVIPTHSEFNQTRANHQILYQMSKHSGGKFFAPDSVKKLIETIKLNENIKPVSFSEKKTTALINIKLMFFIILILLSGEWFFRKFNGGY